MRWRRHIVLCGIQKHPNFDALLQTINSYEYTS